MSRTLKELGEFGLIGRVAQRCRALTPHGVVGVGDDCAVIPSAGGSVRLVTTDLLVENIHFLRAHIPPADLGYKALAVNLSDIAAMGGTPRETYLSIALPVDTDLAWVDAFYEGLLGLARSEGVAVLGGDTTRTPGPVILNVVVIGEGKSDGIRRRSQAVPGDMVCVTGWLGDSAGGLKVILDHSGNVQDDRDLSDLVLRHHRPRPHLEEGRWLAAQSGVHAMMDVSDGLDSDLRHILDASRCGATVDLGQLPISPLLRRACDRFGWNATELARRGGEDYCLLTTIAPDKLEAISSGFVERFGRPLFTVGKLEGRVEDIVYVVGGEQVELDGHGFDHFR